MTTSLRCFLREALLGLWRSRATNLVTIGIIAASLATLGGFLLLVENVRVVADEWDRVQINAYLRDEAAEERPGEVEALVASLRTRPIVREVRYVSRQEALALFRSSFPDLAEAALALPSNPLPASIEIAVRGYGDERRERTGRLLAELKRSPLVEVVQDNEQEARRILAILSVVTRIGFGVGTVLSIASAFIIFNVIRLTLAARRDEIAIMRLVGATPGFIRGPFLVEGMLQGGTGAAAAIAVLYAAQLGLSDYAARSGNDLAELLAARFLPLRALLALVAGGLLIGLAGSALSLRRFLAEPS
ncbi:MAG TPA: ABC transporter permease [Candidatus Polarisedimenticolia bacterium]|nr:ABC transporter permease [Candidatus Polarisedimenticolia bacterium]